MTLQQARDALSAWQAKLSAYGHAMSLISYDGSTVAPKGTAENRGRAMAILSEESYKLATAQETVEMLTLLDEHQKELDEKERRIVFLALKDMRELQKIPMEEYTAYQSLTVAADAAWHTAKETNDFPLFLPHLEKIFETQKRFASYCAPEKKPYDYCLSKYEDSLTEEKCEAFFSTLKAHIVPLVQKISEKEPPSDACLHGDFPIAEQEKLSCELMRVMGIDFDHCALGTTEHPFTTSFGSHHDVRITTHYCREDFSSSMFSVIHEGGHALYDLGSDDALAYTLLDGGVSMGIHESQSRFYENLLGRSHAFIEFIFPRLCEIFPRQMKGYTAEDVYRAVNIVRPSLIRTEADEVTYSIHVMIRYELEKRMMAGEMKASDLPHEWNRLYHEYLGVTVPDDTRGVLQDTHWSFGGIGYFPSYALGSAYGAQLLLKMQETVDVQQCLREGNLAPINAWNREHIWQYGSLYAPNDLLEKALGGPFTPKAYTEYLEQKYKALYAL